VILEALALLRSGPIHEEPEGAMDHRNRDHHIHCDAQRGDSSEESKNQSQAAEELSSDCEEGERGGNVQVPRKVRTATEAI